MDRKSQIQLCINRLANHSLRDIRSVTKVINNTIAAIERRTARTEKGKSKPYLVAEYPISAEVGLPIRIVRER